MTCPSDVLASLSNIFEFAVASSKTNTIDVDMPPAYESCASESDLAFHHVNFVTKLMYMLRHKPSNFT